MCWDLLKEVKKVEKPEQKNRNFDTVNIVGVL